ncbi:MAG TPA: sodium:proton antiporter [Phycisphaerales bacterium]|nr:sodium:proton antiporter [Phycisphaerales bacterium]
MSGQTEHDAHGFHGPRAWLASLAAGATLGAVLTFLVPAKYETGHGPENHATTPAPEEPARNATGEPHGEADDLPDPVTIVWGGDDALALHPGLLQDSGPEGHDPEDPEHANHADDSGDAHDDHGPAPTIPLWLCAPFALLLMSIALMPFVNERFWHKHFPDFAFGLAGITVAYYLLGYGSGDYHHGLSYGQYVMLHTGVEYYAFIALIGGLYVASGGVLIDVRGRGRPAVNTALLAVGAVLANVMGTTGASVLLIRPFMRINKGRLRPIHVVMFIFVVSNCGGCLTPIGDPPLYLGFLKGVPFSWTLLHLWPMWLACCGTLLGVFFTIDTWIERKQRAIDPEAVLAADEPLRVRLTGTSGMVCLGLIIAGVFIDPFLKAFFEVEGVPVGPTFQILVATAAYFVANREIHLANEFTFFPVKEVGLLFVGIFATMAPALGYLAAHGHALGLTSPTAFYFGTGGLSAVLDNAPTYLNFLQVAFGNTPINEGTVAAFLGGSEGVHLLTAISLGAVFFGAMTYIGNGPNFMVRAIAEASGLRMPSFFGYTARAVMILLPVLALMWFVFIR